MYWDPETGELKGGVQKVGYSHKAMADLIVANPAISQNDLAAYFGYTPGWVSQVLASDSFQAYIAERKEEIVDPVLRGAVEESFKGLVLRSVELLRKKLDAAPSDELVMEVFKNASKALGYGARVQVDARVQHTHSLVGVLSTLPPAAPREIIAAEVLGGTSAD